MKFKNIEEAKNAYIEGLKTAQKAIEQGDSKTNNKIIRNQVTPAFDYLKNQNKLSILTPFLEQDDIGIKQPIAVALLPFYEDISVNALEDIIKKEIPFRSFLAEMVLKKWRKEL
jgi:hypothetical protein